MPRANHLDTIPGIGAVTAAVLTAFIVDSGRFDTPGKLVAYFGVLPLAMSSGIDRDGQPRGSRRHVRSQRGNDLVRRYLGMAARSAVRCNPAVRALYRRLVAKHPERKAVAIGHALRKLLHLAFALWKSDRPFDPQHYPWEEPAPVADAAAAAPGQPPAAEAAATSQAAGHEPETKPAAPVVTAACAPTVPPAGRVDEGTFVDFAHVKGQLPLGRVLEQLGLASRLRGSGPPRRGACPLHRGDGRGRTVRVNREANVFHGFEKGCGKEGDVIGLGAELHHLSLRAAALDLVQTFNLEPAPARATEKRNG